MKQILVGVDGSKESRQAASFAASIARAKGGGLLIANSVAPVVATEGAPELILQAQDWQAKEREQAKLTVQEIAASLPSDVPVRMVTPDGAPALALAELAKADDVEMVVVGHRGRNAVARALLGSVADRLVQISPKPVLVVR